MMAFMYVNMSRFVLVITLTKIKTCLALCIKRKKLECLCVSKYVEN